MMTVNDLIEIAKKHKYTEIACVIDGKLVRVFASSFSDEYHALDPDEIDLNAKNLSIIAAIRNHNVLFQLFNPDEEKDENNAYKALDCYGFIDKFWGQSEFPDYPYNDDCLYSMTDDSVLELLYENLESCDEEFDENDSRS